MIESPTLPARTLLTASAAALAVATIVFVVAILPAEYGVDPTGIGRATGIARIWAPPEEKIAADVGGVSAQRSETIPFRSDTFRIPLGPGGDPLRRNALEFKVHMQKGSTMVYSWTVPDRAESALPVFFRSELHGHTVQNGKAMQVVEYRKATGFSDAGALTAPIDGVHGWYVSNASQEPVTMELKLSGFYTLIPAGQVGNEKGILPIGAAKPTAG
jgi:ABC-type antimicrobial peptide transport system permease subunit